MNYALVKCITICASRFFIFLEIKIKWSPRRTFKHINQSFSLNSIYEKSEAFPKISHQYFLNCFEICTVNIQIKVIHNNEINIVLYSYIQSNLSKLTSFTIIVWNTKWRYYVRKIKDCYFPFLNP